MVRTARPLVPCLSVALATLGTLATGCSDHPLKQVEATNHQVCGEDLSYEVIRPQTMLVLDKSGSMHSETWDDDGDPQTPPVTRWSTLHASVDELVYSQQKRVDFGLVLFPSTQAESTDYSKACLTEVEPAVSMGTENADAVMSAIPAADAEVEGGTPASLGMQAAIDHLESLETDQPRIMILVTDGAANCRADTEGKEVGTVYDDTLPELVAGAAAEGLPTYVIGIDIRDEVGTAPVVNPYEALNEVAEAGGRARDGETGFYDVRNAEELAAAIESISGAQSCEIALEDDVDVEAPLLVSVDDEARDEVTDCAEDGWRWVSQGDGNQRIELCGASCEDFRFSGQVALDQLCG